MSRVVWVMFGETGQKEMIVDRETAVSLSRMDHENLIVVNNVPDSVSDMQLLMLVRWRKVELNGCRAISYSQLVALHL